VRFLKEYTLNMGERNGSFISELFAKLSYTIGVQEKTGKSTAGAQKEVKR
jgi:hypothetical protein